MKSLRNSENSLMFIVIGGNDVGFGHFNRAISLSKYAERSNFATSFLIFGDKKTQEIARKNKLDYLFRHHEMFNESYFKGIFEEIKYKDIFIIDISHPKFIGDLIKIEKLFTLIRKFAKKIVIIDSMPNNALASRLAKFFFDILIIPYVCKTKHIDNFKNELFGPKYAILAPQYENLKSRKINKIANKILISTGGSDPTNLSLIILEALVRFNKKLEIKIVIGPLFSNYLKLKIKLACFVSGLSKHSISLISPSECIADLMLWSDLTVTSSGLIKYELAVTGTPAITISTDLLQDEANKQFAKRGSILD